MIATWDVLVDCMAALMKLIFIKTLLFCIRSAFFYGSAVSLGVCQLNLLYTKIPRQLVNR